MNENQFRKKLSPLLNDLVPEFVRNDHPVFVNFLKKYYEFLESAQLSVTGTNNYLIEETVTVNFILSEDSEKVVLEDSDVKFAVGETIVGDTSGATATLLVDNFDDAGVLYISANQQFITGETVTGQTTGATALILEYRANPVQNIQQLLEYADPDYTISDFLSNFRDSFLEGIPDSLADGLSKRNLIKNIRDLYSAKGTKKGHELFFRILFDETPEITFPRDNILRTSDGQWSTDTIMRVVETGSSDFTQLIGQTITGQTSGATAIISTVTKFREGATLIAELSLDVDSIEGTFVAGETVEGISTTLDLTISAVVRSILIDVDITRAGAYYSVGDNVTIGTGGNSAARARIGQIGTGGVDEIVIADGGTGYAIGDIINFDNTSTSGVGASAKISVIGGGVALEQFTEPDQLITENEENILVEHTDNFELEDGTVETQYILEETDGDNILFEDGGLLVSETSAVDDARSQSIETDLSGDLILEDGNQLVREDAEIFFLSKEQTVGDVDNLVFEDGGTIVLETGTFANAFLVTLDETNGHVDLTAGFSDAASEIAKVTVTNSGNGYRNLPLVSIASSGGSGASLVPKSTSGIGSIQNIEITNFGLDYDTTPTLRMNRVILVSGVSGTFTAGDSLTSHDGSVVTFDSARGLLELDTDAGFTDGDSITTVTGATATVVQAPFATATSVVGTTGTKVGQFITDRGKVSVDTMRIQDSFFYQDYSYVVRIGESILTWRDALKRSVHPSGWNVFGEVSFATSVSARIQVPAGGVTTFTPELASLFDVIFSPVVPRRLGTTSDGTTLIDGAVYDELDDVPSGRREVTLTSAVTVRMDTGRGSFYSGPTLDLLPKYAFAVPPIDSVAQLPHYPGINRTVTQSDNQTRDLYTIDQFGDIRINQVSVPVIQTAEFDSESDTFDSDSITFDAQDTYKIPDDAFTTRINVPPPSEIIVTTGGTSFDDDALTFDDTSRTFDVA